jgi:hypothetical protein
MVWFFVFFTTKRNFHAPVLAAISEKLAPVRVTVTIVAPVTGPLRGPMLDTETTSVGNNIFKKNDVKFRGYFHRKCESNHKP